MKVQFHFGQFQGAIPGMSSITPHTEHPKHLCWGSWHRDSGCEQHTQHRAQINLQRAGLEGPGLGLTWIQPCVQLAQCASSSSSLNLCTTLCWPAQEAGWNFWNWFQKNGHKIQFISQNEKLFGIYSESGHQFTSVNYSWVISFYHSV